MCTDAVTSTLAYHLQAPRNYVNRQRLNNPARCTSCAAPSINHALALLAHPIADLTTHLDDTRTPALSSCHYMPKPPKRAA